MFTTVARRPFFMTNNLQTVPRN